jgi:hypothetical protein
MPCAHDGRQRPAAVTCAERCERFPKCVPSASPKLKTVIDGTLQAGAAERDAIASVLDTLEALVPTIRHGEPGMCIQPSRLLRR